MTKRHESTPEPGSKPKPKPRPKPKAKSKAPATATPTEVQSERTILSVDDDSDIRDLVSTILGDAGYHVLTAASASEALGVLADRQVDLILLDVMMPEVDGYMLCEAIQEADLAPLTPIIFMTALSEDDDRARAFGSGAVDYIVKPISRDVLLEKVVLHLETARTWSDIDDQEPSEHPEKTVDDFVSFRTALAERFREGSSERDAVSGMRPGNVYAVGQSVGIASDQMAVAIAAHLSLDFVSLIDVGTVALGTLPAAFCRNNLVVPVSMGSGVTFVFANPFDREIVDIVQQHAPGGAPLKIAVGDPENIRALFRQGGLEGRSEDVQDVETTSGQQTIDDEYVSADDIESRPIVFIANSLIASAIRDRASDIHVEPKESVTHIRFRVDGDMHDKMSLKRQTAHMLISRFKAIGGLDIAEHRRPQDGMVETTVDGKRIKMRLATTSGPYGESIVIRLLDTSTKPQTLQELGMAEEQAQRLYGYAERAHGMILVVGPTGSGKTTTLYSVLSSVNTDSRSLMSVEDPVEYVIPRANQQQVNDKAGVTFESLLKSSVRQDPDVLYLGEIRDQFSARTGLDFASTGHLTVTTLHTSNATTAIFRLERLGIERSMMADAVLCIVAQRLLKRLCPSCRSVVPITEEERGVLAPFTDDIPEEVAHPVGCPACRDGYRGRVGVHEVLDFDRDVANWIRDGVPISDIRRRVRARGSYLLTDSAIDKVRSFDVSVSDVYERVLVEEEPSDEASAPEASVPLWEHQESDLERTEIGLAEPQSETPTFRRPWGSASGSADGEASGEGFLIGVSEALDRPRVLIADDDPPTRDLLAKVLRDADYDVSLAVDGVSALARIHERPFDLILSDINMPGLDGLGLLDRLLHEGITTPVIMLTGVTVGEAEASALQLGAVDFVRKPVRKDVLLLRVRRVLEHR